MQLGMLLDATGSMQHDTHRTIDGFNEYIAGLKGNDTTAEAELTLATFNSEIGVFKVHDGILVKATPPLTQNEYRCAGVTPLYDAIGRLIGLVARRAIAGEKVLIVINTDGLENASAEYTRDAIFKLIKEKEQQGNWTFVFLGADIDAWEANKSMGLGVSSSNTRSYNKAATGQTMRDLAGHTQAYAMSAASRTDDFYGSPDPGLGKDKDKGQGPVTAESVVAQAQSPSSPLHKHFEWGDKEATNAWQKAMKATTDAASR